MPNSISFVPAAPAIPGPMADTRRPRNRVLAANPARLHGSR